MRAEPRSRSLPASRSFPEMSGKIGTSRPSEMRAIRTSWAPVGQTSDPMSCRNVCALDDGHAGVTKKSDPTGRSNSPRRAPLTEWGFRFSRQRIRRSDGSSALAWLVVGRPGWGRGPALARGVTVGTWVQSELSPALTKPRVGNRRQHPAGRRSHGFVRSAHVRPVGAAHWVRAGPSAGSVVRRCALRRGDFRGSHSCGRQRTGGAEGDGTDGPLRRPGRRGRRCKLPARAVARA